MRNVFFFVIRILHAVHMDNQQHSARNKTYKRPNRAESNFCSIRRY